MPHLNKGKLGDCHVDREVTKGLPGFPDNPTPIANERGDCLSPLGYGFRSFDRQCIIPDNRVLNRPNPELWRSHGEQQVYMTAPSDRSPTKGPASWYILVACDGQQQGAPKPLKDPIPDRIKRGDMEIALKKLRTE